MKKVGAIVIVLLGLLLPAASAQTSNTFNAKEFPGNDKGSKVAAAQAQCNLNTSIPCIIIIDPILAAFPPGTMPTKCAQCLWQDYTTPGAVVIANSYSIRIASAFGRADCGANVNAADADLGVTAGEIWVNQACGTTWTTPFSISTTHALRFVQGGTYTMPAGNTVASSGGVVALSAEPVVLKLANSANGILLKNANATPILNISTISRIANVVTVVTTAAHGLSNGNTVLVTEVSPAAATTFAGTFSGITVDSATQFHYSQTAANDTGAGGVVSLQGSGDSGIYLQNLILDGNKANQAVNAPVLFMQSVSKSIFENVTVQNGFNSPNYGAAQFTDSSRNSRGRDGLSTSAVITSWAPVAYFTNGYCIERW
jgi:hypothetical protein